MLNPLRIVILIAFSSIMLVGVVLVFVGFELGEASKKQYVIDRANKEQWFVDRDKGMGFKPDLAYRQATLRKMDAEFEPDGVTHRRIGYVAIGIAISFFIIASAVFVGTRVSSRITVS